METLSEAVLVFVVLTNMRLLGASRIGVSIRTVAIQGGVLGLLPFLVHGGSASPRAWVLALAGIGLKGIVFPWLLTRALRRAKVSRESEPFVSPVASSVVGVLLLAAAVQLGSRLPPTPVVGSDLALPVAFFTILCGLFLIVSRRKALTQVIGYLVLENGIYSFGVAIALEEPLLVELGVLLDVFVAVFVMGIAVFHISREFDSMDTTRLSALKD